MISPGTSVRASTSSHFSLRSARAFSARELFKASSALEASCSSQNPNKALNSRSEVMIVKSPQSPTIKAISAAASIIHGIGPQKYATKAESALFFSSASAFGPYLFRRSCSSAGFKPILGSTPNFVRVSATVGLVDPVAFGVGMNNSSAHLTKPRVITCHVFED